MPDQLRCESAQKEQLPIKRLAPLLTRFDFAEQLVHQRHMACFEQGVRIRRGSRLRTRWRARQEIHDTTMQRLGARFEKALIIRFVALLDLGNPARREPDQRSKLAQAKAPVFAPVRDISSRQRLGVGSIAVLYRQGTRPFALPA